jgi:outer membrane lipoprotein
MIGRTLLLLPLLFVPLLFAGCATAPAYITTGPFSAFTPQTAQEAKAVGERVRWGGTIISVTPLKAETCFEILSRPLDSDGEPKSTDATEGRFLACGAGFYDPAAYPAGRSLTVVGKIQPATTCKVGEYSYPCPRVAIESLYLWPQRQYYYPYPYYYDPFWDPYWPYYRHRYYWWP